MDISVAVDDEEQKCPQRERRRKIRVEELEHYYEHNGEETYNKEEDKLEIHRRCLS